MAIRCFLVHKCKYVDIKVYYSNMNKKMVHAIHMFIVRFVHKNYHFVDVIFSLFEFRQQGNE